MSITQHSIVVLTTPTSMVSMSAMAMLTVRMEMMKHPAQTCALTMVYTPMMTAIHNATLLTALVHTCTFNVHQGAVYQAPRSVTVILTVLMAQMNSLLCALHCYAR